METIFVTKVSTENSPRFLLKEDSYGVISPRDAVFSPFLSDCSTNPYSPGGSCSRLINFNVQNLLLMTAKSSLRKMFQYFLQGLIILAPISITIVAVVSLFNWIDRILPNFIHTFFPKLLGSDEFGNLKTIPGLGFIVVVAIVLLVGYVSGTFIVSKLVELFDRILEKTPGIKVIYSTVKDFLEAFAGNKRKFNKAVLVNTESIDVWRVGFITDEDLHEFGMQEYVAVYVPQSYAFSGNLYLVKRDRVRMVTDVSATDTMKFAISGGVTEIDDE
jgi:uncharacterized membrane protein